VIVNACRSNVTEGPPLTPFVPDPVLDSITPASAIAGLDTVRIDVFGSNFVPAALVHFDGRARPTTFVSATRLTVRALPADLSDPRTIPVTVANPSSAGTPAAVTFTVTPRPLPAVAEISAAVTHTCAHTASGRTFCWGGHVSQVTSGDESTDQKGPEYGLVPVEIAAPRLSAIGAGGSSMFRVAAGDLRISVGHNQSCGLDAAGAAFCWGANWAGQLGNGMTNSDPGSATPVPVSGGLWYSALSVGVASACGITPIGAVYCWGASFGNSPQLLGSGYLDVEAQSALTSFFEPAHLCALNASRQVHCWRSGSGTTTPELRSGSLSVATMSLGRRGILCAITTEQRLYCWASGSHGLPASSLRFTSVSVGPDDHYCALATTNELYCWGIGTSGQLGTGSSTNAELPTLVPGNLRFRSVTAGDRYTCAVTVDGRWYCWGLNTFGQLGNCTTTSSNVPVAVIMPTDAMPPR
jgi:alpha-tubulin suppressor-like RCC1 family protein